MAGSPMIRVLEPLVERVRTLNDLYRQGKGEQVIAALDQVISQIKTAAAITLLSAHDLGMISADSKTDISTLAPELTERIESLEHVISPLIACDVETRIARLEAENREIKEVLSQVIAGDNTLDELNDTRETSGDSTPQPEGLRQVELRERLGKGAQRSALSYPMKQGPEYFAQWTQQQDPEGLAWRWEGQGAERRFFPIRE